MVRGMKAMALLLALQGCSLLDPYNMIGRQLGEAEPVPTEVVPRARRPLDAAARAEAFDFVWNTIHERYHDPSLNGVDWKAVGERYRPIAMHAPDDEAFWDLLDRMTGELKDSHTRIESPKRVELRKRDETITVGFAFMPIEGRLAVTTVNTDSDAWWAGVRPGMTLAAVNGEPAAAAYDRALAETRFDSTDRSRHMRVMRRLLAGDEGTHVDMSFLRSDGTRFDAKLTRRRLATRPTETHRILPSGFGYLRFTQWSLRVLPQALEGIDALRGTPGIVIDLRGNPGGSVHAVNMMLERFFSRPVDLGHSTTRTGKPISMLFGTVEIIKLKSEVEGRKDAYQGPVVILLNAQSASGSELFAGTMQATGRAVVAGETSCGCLLGFLGYARVPGGAELAYSEVGFVMANGRRIEGNGVVPDYPVPLTLSDLMVNRDRALEAAQDVLRRLSATKG